jgi:hypothetical protein
MQTATHWTQSEAVQRHDAWRVSYIAYRAAIDTLRLQRDNAIAAMHRNPERPRGKEYLAWIDGQYEVCQRAIEALPVPSR